MRGGTLTACSAAATWYSLAGRPAPGPAFPDLRAYETSSSPAPTSLPYSTAAYLDLLLTYSGHRALPDAQQSALLNSIARLIDIDHGGQVVKRYLTELRLAQRVR